MDRELQTLELLQLLGDDVAESVLTHLQPDRAEKLRSSLKSDPHKQSTIRRQREVLDEFECFFQFAMKSLPGESGADPDSNPSVAGEADLGSRSATGQPSNSRSGESRAAVDNVQLAALLEANSAEDTHESEHSMASLATPRQPPLSGDPLLDLQTLSSHQLAQALGSEQSRTCAILLSNLPAMLTGTVLNLLKPEYQRAVMQELTKEQHAPAVLIERIARATFARAQQLPANAPDTRDHADRVAEVLRSVPRTGRRNMLAAIEEQNPDLAKSLLTRIYRFEDIAGLHKTVIQRILGEIDSANLTTALYGAAQEITDAIFANLSKRARQTIEEEMQFMSNLSESRIGQARNSIAEIIARIDMESES